MTLSYPLNGQIADLGLNKAFGSLANEGFPLHEHPVYIEFPQEPMHQFIWGLRFLRKRLLEPTTISIQYSKDSEKNYYLNNAKYAT